MSERVPAQNKTSATPSQATQASSPLLHRRSLTDEQSESVGSSSNISQELGGIQPKTIRRSLNWQNIFVEAPSRGNGMSLPGGIQRQQQEEEETPAIEHQVSAKKAETSTGELSNLTRATEGSLHPKTDRGRLNWRNISVEAPPRSGEASSQPIQRQQEEQQETPEIQAQLAADSAEKSALESSTSTISTSEPAQKPLITRTPFNGQNIPVEASQRLSASSAYPEGIQRLETSGVKEQEKSTESLQMQPEEEIQAKSSSGEPQEKEEQNQELVQTKLTVGAPGDKYEQEADSMAAKVMTMPDSAIKPPIQRQAGEDTEAVQMQPLVNSISPLVQRESGTEEEVQMKSGAKRASDGSSVASSSIENRLASSKGGGSPLPDNVRRFMEPRFGADFSNIKVHTDSNAVQMNKEVGAQAFAHGGDIYFGAGKSPGNNELTAHELTHTIQQGAAGRMNKEVRRQPQQEEEQETVQAKEISISGKEKSNQVSLSNKESSFQASEPETETLAAKALSGYNTNLSLNKELRQKPQEEEQETTQEEPIQAKQFTNSPSSSNKNTIQCQSLAVTSVSPRIQGDFLGIGNPIDKIKGAIAGFAKQLPGYSLLTLILGKDPRGIHGEVNPTSEADSQAELSEQEKLKVIAKVLNANKDQIIEQLGQNPGSRNQTRNETLSQLRTMDKNSSPEFEGYILDSILEENREAFRTIKSLLAKEPPDVLMAMERGGAFLGDVLSHNNEELTSKLHKIEKGTDPNPDPNKKLRFNPEAFKSAIRTQIGSGKKSFALVDAYMGGRFAAELRDHVIKPLLTEFGQGKIKFYLFWLRETFGFEQADSKERGFTIRKPQGTISEKSPYAQDVKTVHVNVRVVLGDDMSMVFDPNSQQPFHIFDAEGNIIKTIQPEKGETSRDTLIKLLNG
jgi:hypothetical protein